MSRPPRHSCLRFLTAFLTAATMAFSCPRLPAQPPAAEEWEITPQSEAAIAKGLAFLAKKQNGIYALVWQVADAERAKAHFTGGQLKLRLTEEDCVSPGFAIDPEDFFGGRHEFVTG